MLNMLVRSKMITRASAMVLACRKESVESSVRGLVGMVTLNRSKALNALNLEMIQTLTPILK